MTLQSIDFNFFSKIMKGNCLFFVVQVVLVLTLQATLSEKIRCKKRRLRQLTFEYDRIKQKLQYQLSPIDFMHVL